MRWPLVVAAALVVASCGSATETETETGDPQPSSASAGTVEARDGSGGVDEEVGRIATVQEAAAATIAQFGDDDVATAATFLALDAGYDVAQIVEAGPSGRLLVDGSIVDTDDTAVVPARTPPNLIIDDVTAHGAVAGFRQTTQRPLSSVMVRFHETVEPPDKEMIYQRLFVLMALMQQGYTLEQIVNALFTLGGLDDELRLTDAGNRVVEPDEEPFASLELTTEDYDRAWTTTTTTTTETPKTDEEQQLDVLIERAVGVYSITQDLGTHLQGLGDVVSVVPPTGQFVVADDGTISGSFAYTIVQGVDDARLTSSWDRTLVEATLTVLDDGLSFSAPMDLMITWNEGDQQPYVENVSGIIDVDTGELVVTGFTELDSVRFTR